MALGDEILDDDRFVIGICLRGDFWNGELSEKIPKNFNEFFFIFKVFIFLQLKIMTKLT